MKPYGYYVPAGYMGRVKNGSMMLFETEGAYLSYILEEEE